MEKLTMELVTLDMIPDFRLPTEYRLVPYRPGDERHWHDIHLLADKYSGVDDQLHYRQFGDDPKVLHQRQFFIHHHSRVIGTASAWYNKTYKDGTFGQVHWVAIEPEYQGLGLSKPLMSAVLKRLHELGHEKAMLFTDSRRLAAIALYSKFGFVIVDRKTVE